MAVEAKLRYSRISPRKVRLVADLIRGLRVEEAEKVLQFTIKRSANPMLKVLQSAVANAEHNFNLKKENLYISEIRVDGGPIIKRFRPRARGAASAIQKKTSHIFIELKEKGKESYSPENARDKKEKTTEIKKVYQEEKPKEEASRRLKAKHTESGRKEEARATRAEKDAKSEKKQIFRRKSI